MSPSPGMDEIAMVTVSIRFCERSQSPRFWLAETRSRNMKQEKVCDFTGYEIHEPRREKGRCHRVVTHKRLKETCIFLCLFAQRIQDANETSKAVVLSPIVNALIMEGDVSQPTYAGTNDHQHQQNKSEIVALAEKVINCLQYARLYPVRNRQSPIVLSCKRLRALTICR